MKYLKIKHFLIIATVTILTAINLQSVAEVSVGSSSNTYWQESSASETVTWADGDYTFYLGLIVCCMPSNINNQCNCALEEPECVYAIRNGQCSAYYGSSN